MNEELTIQQDRMRFEKNTKSSRLAILAIILNVFYFISIYSVNKSAYYTYWMGISIVYNLVFMLAAFLCSEGAKNYNAKYSKLLVLLGIGQFIRITEGVPVEKGRAERARSVSDSYTKLRIAAARLDKVLDEARGLPNKELDRFTKELNDLCRKYQIPQD